VRRQTKKKGGGGVFAAAAAVSPYSLDKVTECFKKLC